MAMTMKEYLAIDTFLQQVVVCSPDVRPLGYYLRPDVVILDNFVWKNGFVVLAPIERLPPRILVIEDMAHEPIMRYPKLAAAAGYRWHRGKIFEVEGRGDVALLEFHRKEPDNAESPQ